MSPSFQPDSRVDEHIDALPDRQREICHELRALIHAADPGLSETVGVQTRTRRA